MVATSERRLVTAGDPDAPFPVPSEREFGSDFMQGNDLKEIGDALIREKFPDLDDGELIIDYAWKKKGGLSGGNAILGKCIKLSGVSRYYALGAHFLIWVAADWARVHHLTRWQIEATVYHELCHVVREERADEDGNILGVTYKTRGHEAELFYGEIEEYGLWKRNLQRLAEAVQPALPFEAIQREEVRRAKAMMDEARTLIEAQP